MFFLNCKSIRNLGLVNPITMPHLPVIFLAFANDKVETARYLRNLPKELEGIRKSLYKAQQAGLCEVVERANVTIENLIDVFQEYQERVCVFHYGGHADGYRLLLESFDNSNNGMGNQTAHGEGLVSFLAKQAGLKLIFFNGCSTQQQTMELIRGGIPAVVGTSMAIADDIATDLAIRFYAGLANGITLERAWAEAIDNIVIKKGSTNVRGMYREEEEETSVETLAERFPWEIHYREGSEAVKEWNLPIAANNPLFGLPPIPGTYQLPDRPFLYLKRYEREHAKLFFGRSYYIGSLYKLVTDRKSAPVVLMYGQAGVGKSSLLDAGLVPRLEASYEVVYIRRAQERGLLGALEDALGLSQERLNLRQLELIAKDYKGEVQVELQSFIDKLRGRLTAVQRGKLSEAELEDYLLRHDLLKFWKSLEYELGKPLIIILDQAEEMFTRPMKKEEQAKRGKNRDTTKTTQHAHHEFAPFLDALTRLFGNPADMPQGKLILSYRKEYHPEIEEGLKMYSLPRGSLFLEQLKARDIVEIFNAFATRPDLLQKYQIGSEVGLPEAVAADLTAETGSPVAPLLQIVLSRLWDEHEKNHEKCFQFSDYAALQRYGISVYDFFIQQLKKLRAWNGSLVDSGFALDFLRFHITDLGISASHQVEELRLLYAHRQADLENLIDQSHSLSLLVQVRQGTYMLHDTLAPEVLRKFNESDKEAQRAARILASKLADIESVRSNEDLDEARSKAGIDEIIITESDLDVVECGLQWMRQVGSDEAALLDRSRKKRRQADNKRKWTYASLAVLGVLVVCTMLLAFRLWRTAERSLARAQASQLMARATQLKESDPTLALRVAEAAWKLNPSSLVERDLMDIFTNNQFYGKKIQLDLDDASDQVSPSPSGHLFATFGQVDVVPRLIDENGKEVVKFSGSPHQSPILAIAFSPDGQRFLTGSTDSTAKLWNIKGEQLLTLKYHRDGVSFVGFSPSGDNLLTGSTDGSAAMWNLEGQLKFFLPASNDHLFMIGVSPDGQAVVTLDGSPDKPVKIWNSTGELLYGFNPTPDGVIRQVNFTADGKRLFLVASTEVSVLDLAGNPLTKIESEPDRGFTSALLLADGKTVVTASSDIRTWWLAPNANPELLGIYKNETSERGNVASALFVLNDGGFLSQSNGYLYTWNLGGNAVAASDFSAKADQVQWPKKSNKFATIGYTADGQSECHIWQYDPSKRVLADSASFSLPSNASSFALAPQLSYVAVQEPSDTLSLYDLSGKLIRRIDLSPAGKPFGYAANAPIVISNDDSLIAVGHYLQGQLTIRVMDRSGRWLADLPTNSNLFTEMIFGRNNQYLITINYEGVKNWELATGKLVLEIGGRNYKPSISLSPDGQKALVANFNNSALIIHLFDRNVKPIELPSNGEELLDFAYLPTREEVVLLRKDRTITRWSTQGNRLGIYPISLSNKEVSINPLNVSGDGRFFVISTDRDFLLYDAAIDLGQQLESAKIAHFDAIDFAEAKVPSLLTDLDTLTNATDLSRVARFYVNEDRQYDFGDLKDKDRYELAEQFYAKSLKVKRSAGAVEGLASLYLMRAKKFDLLKLLSKDASVEDLRHHSNYLINDLIGRDSSRSREFAPPLKAICLLGIGKQRSVDFVKGLLQASRILREEVPRNGLDTLFRSSNLSEMREYADLAANVYTNRLTRKDNMLRAAQLWERVLRSGQSAPQYEDSVQAAKVSSRLAWYHLSDGEFPDAEAALNRVGQLDKAEPHQYPNRVLFWLITGRADLAKRNYLARKGTPFDVNGGNTDKKFEEVFNESAQNLRGKGILKPQNEQTIRSW